MEANAQEVDIQDMIKCELEKEYVKSSIDQLIYEAVSNETGRLRDVDPEAVVRKLMNSEAVQTLLTRLDVERQTPTQKSHPHNSSLPEHIKKQIVPGHQYLCVQLGGGRAFVEHLRTGSETVTAAPNVTRTLSIRLALLNQRAESREVPCVCEPEVNDTFLFDLQCLKPGHCTTLDSNQLLFLSPPLTMAVVRSAGCPGAPATLISAHQFDWRLLLSRSDSSAKVTCHLMGLGSEQQVPVGLLDIRASIIPPLDSPLPASAVTEHIENWKKSNGEKRRLLVTYARAWWQEYLQAGEANVGRLVKMFVNDEFGNSRFVCEFVRYLDVGRVVRCPEEAARWISLLPQPTASQDPPSDTLSPWYLPPTALLAPSMNIETKCVVLCGMLLGFGLDAWVCSGSRNDKSNNAFFNYHTWVMTRGPYSAITFWEVPTGFRYLHRVGQEAIHSYNTIGSVFNYKHLYANIQASDKVVYCTFNLEDQSCWKMMSPTVISRVTDDCTGIATHHPPFTPAASNCDAYSDQLETSIKALIAQYRGDCGLSTTFDNQLSQVLTTALWSYEREAVKGHNIKGNHAMGHELFTAAIINTIPDGHTFKAVPIHFTNCTPMGAFNILLRSSIGREVVECRGESVKVAVRVVTVCYPQNVNITWLMVACYTRAIPPQGYSGQMSHALFQRVKKDNV